MNPRACLEPVFLRSVRRGARLVAAALLVLAAPAGADGPVLHEYVEPDEHEDLSLSATTADGTMPAVLDTPSGVVRAPDPVAPTATSEEVYGGSATPNSPDARYRIDRDTTRPEAVGYDDPFIPAVTPFKRLYAYDAVDRDLELVVHDKQLVPIPIGKERPAGAGDDQFYGDLVVDLAAGEAVRIASVGPGARVQSASTTPPVRFELLRDGADNWFIRAAERRRVRLIVQLVIDRAVFGSQFPDATHGQLASALPPLPPAARAAASEVIETLGIPVTLSPAAALEALVAHFRAFAPSTERPTATGVELYRELALSQKGVCRHRSYAFVITAQALGIPARMVRNEAHAWVEVYDGRIWHRIDLGGAAGRLDTEPAAQGARHVPPPDTYQWPEGSESGVDLANRAMGGPPGGGAPSDPGVTAPSEAPELTAPAPDSELPEAVDSAASERLVLPPAVLTLSSPGGDVRRGEPLRVAGRVSVEGEPCGGARVDVGLRSGPGRPFPLGSLPADEAGSFSGSVTVRLDLEVGDYELVLATPGTASCGPGQL